MTDRPTPEEIADFIPCLSTHFAQREAIRATIIDEREEADRRVVEERSAIIDFLLEEISDDFHNPDGADLVRELAARVERGEPRK